MITIANIKEAIISADMRKKSMLTKVNSDFICRNNDRENLKGGVYFSREDNRVEINKFVGLHKEGKNLIFEDINNNNDNYKCYYESSKINFDWYAIYNPQEPGANGYKIRYNVNNNKRVMIVSGPLTGCGFSILYKNGEIIVVHAGAENTNVNPNINPEERRKFINRDIYNTALCLTEGNPNLANGGLTYEELIIKLEEKEFKGYIFGKSELKTIMYSITQSITLETYTTQFQDNNGNLHDYLKADVVFIMNENLQTSVALRSIIDFNSVDRKVIQYISHI
ncbi:MAG: hypothetical protein Q4F95_08550 [Oscillospiraceae bacterium]|nr:hypothetical protein [Oscillospiraceae bacterium]